MKEIEKLKERVAELEASNTVLQRKLKESAQHLNGRTEKLREVESIAEMRKEEIDRIRIAYKNDLDKLKHEIVDSKLVSMTFSNSTIQHIENIKKLTNEENKARIIATSVKLTHEILKSMKKGDKVYIEKEDGDRELISFIGI